MTLPSRDPASAIAELRVGPNGIVRRASREATALLGIRRRRLIDADFFDVVFPRGVRERERSAFERLLLGGAGTEATREAPLLDGRTIVRWHWLVVSRRDRLYAIVRPAAVLRRGRSDPGLVERNRLSTLGQLAAAIAHEIISPISGMKACLRSLRDDSLSETERKAYFDVVLDSLDRLERIATQALDFGRRPSGAIPLEPVDGARLLDDCVVLLHPRLRRKSLSLESSLATAEDGLIAGNRSQLMQAVMNVLTNAIDAAPEHSTIALGVVRRGDYVELSVHDRGAGIPRRSLATLGLPFFTTKPEGSGLGISVTRSIVAAHRGKLLFRSGRGEGTVVTLVLPATSRGNAA